MRQALSGEVTLVGQPASLPAAGLHYGQHGGSSGRIESVSSGPRGPEDKGSQ